MTLIQIRELKPESLYFPGIKDRRKSKAVFLNYFIHTAEISRHQLAFQWKIGTMHSSHIITMEKLPNGKLRIYDLQTIF